MTRFFYAVTATIPDPETAEQYKAWLADGHVRAVLDAGAESARVIDLDDDGTVRIETQYVFPSRDAFRTYEKGPAVALREEGKRRFGSRHVTFERRHGDLIDAG